MPVVVVVVLAFLEKALMVLPELLALPQTALLVVHMAAELAAMAVLVAAELFVLYGLDVYENFLQLMLDYLKKIYMTVNDK